MFLCTGDFWTLGSKVGLPVCLARGARHNVICALKPSGSTNPLSQNKNLSQASIIS
jgi:hypothetical protein